jgi:type IV pilus assembly protein PilY1
MISNVIKSLRALPGVVAITVLASMVHAVDDDTETYHAGVGTLSRAATFTSPAVAVDTFTHTRNRDEVFYAMFQPGHTVDRIGNIKKLKLNANGVLVDSGGEPAFDASTGEIKSTATSYWSGSQDGPDVDRGGVGGLLAARDPATRTLYSNTGTNSTLEVFNNTHFTADALGLATDAQLFSLLGASDQASFDRQLDWGRGFDAYDKDGDTITNEPRNWILGDILHSRPLVLNYGALGSATAADPDLRLLVGSNSGFVHLFSNSDGREDWAFFPKELAVILPQRRRNAVSNDHVYGMDLTPVVYTYDSNQDGTLDASAGDKAWVYLGMRRGGRAYYALDVSSPDSPRFMWRIDHNSHGFGELGQTWSEPQITTIPGYKDASGVRKPVLVFGAGYDTGKDQSGVGTADQEGRGIYIVDAQTGTLVWSVTPAASSNTNLRETGLLHSVPGKVTLLDSNADGLTDRIYFGDTGGNVWRVDLPGNALPTLSQDTWQINKLGAFNGGSLATDRRFFNAPDLVRIRLDGRAVDAVIIGSGDRANPNASGVYNRVYMIRDIATVPYNTSSPSLAACSDKSTLDFRCTLPLSDDDLYDISDNTIITDADGVEAPALADLQGSHGWRFDLSSAGEKSLAQTVTLNGRAFVPAFTPLSGDGQMYIFDIYSGDTGRINLGSNIPAIPSLHFSEDGTIRFLLPPGAPASSTDQSGEVECEGAVCDPQESLRSPYGNVWFQEGYE